MAAKMATIFDDVTGPQQRILGDPGADGRGERQIKRTKSVRAEAWCERKFITRAGTAPGRIPLTD